MKIHEGKQSRTAALKCKAREVGKTLELFDILPPRIRKTLAEASLNFDPLKVNFLLMQGKSEEYVIWCIQKSEMKEREWSAMEQIWGVPGHPQAILNGKTIEEMGL